MCAIRIAYDPTRVAREWHECSMTLRDGTVLPVLREYLRKNRPRRFIASVIPEDALSSKAL